LVLLGEEEVCTLSKLSTAEEISLYVYTIAYTNWPPGEVTQNFFTIHEKGSTQDKYSCQFSYINTWYTSRGVYIYIYTYIAKWV